MRTRIFVVGTDRSIMAVRDVQIWPNLTSVHTVTRELVKAHPNHAQIHMLSSNLFKPLTPVLIK